MSESNRKGNCEVKEQLLQKIKNVMGIRIAKFQKEVHDKMKAEIVTMTEEQPDILVLERAGEILQQGGLVAFPTETVYGLGGNALDPEASRKIYSAKGRPSDNPLIIHIADMEHLYRIVRQVPKKAETLAERYWPGPLTMILKRQTVFLLRQQEDWTVLRCVCRGIVLRWS